MATRCLGLLAATCIGLSVVMFAINTAVNHLKLSYFCVSLTHVHTQLEPDQNIFCPEGDINQSGNLDTTGWNLNFTKLWYLWESQHVDPGSSTYLTNITEAIQWINCDYIGYCRNYLYPYIAFPTHLKLDSHIFNTPIEMFNTTHLWPNMTRANYFTGHFKSSWMICSLNVLYYNYTDVGLQNEMVVEIIVSVNDASRCGVEPRGNNAKDATFTGEKFLCVFSDGTVVYSAKVTKTYVGMFKIACVISHKIDLVSKILQQDEKNRVENDFVSRLGLTIFPLKRHDSIQLLVKQFEIAKRVQLPVCTQLVVNNKPQIYASEQEYYRLPSYQRADNNKHKKRTHVQLHSSLPNPGAKKYFLSIGSLIYPTQAAGGAKSDLLQANLLLQQSIDWYLFQGFDHLYLYTHTYKRPKETISYFYDYLTEHGYMVDYLSNSSFTDCIYDECPITLIEWNMHQLPGSQRYFQEVGSQDVVQRFMHQSEYIFINDVDELLVPLQREDVDKNAKQILTKYLKTDEEITDQIMEYATIILQQDSDGRDALLKQNLNIKYTAASFKTVPAFQNVYKLLYDRNYADSNGKKLGCDIENESNRFDTFVARQSCFQYQPVRGLSYRGLVSLLKKSVAFVGYDGLEAKATNLPALHKVFNPHDNSLYDVFPKFMPKANHYFYVYHHQLYVERRQLHSFEDVPKQRAFALLQKTLDLNDTDRLYLSKIQKEMKISYKQMQFGMIEQKPQLVSLHLRDHWTHLFMKGALSQDNGVDMTALWTMTKHDCPHQDDVLFWNERFLNSSYGSHYNNSLAVNPLIDGDGVFCSVRVENSSFVLERWHFPAHK